MVYVLGVVAGTFLFGESFPWTRAFYESSDLGKLTLPQAFRCVRARRPPLVVLMALGGFAGAEWVERFGGNAEGAK